jgi:hypothetical protein
MARPKRMSSKVSADGCPSSRMPTKKRGLAGFVEQFLDALGQAGSYALAFGDVPHWLAAVTRSSVMCRRNWHRKVA